MNVRQLLWDTMSGKSTERVPIAPFLFNNAINEHNGGEPADPIAAGIDLYKHYGFDIILRNYIISDYLDDTLISCADWRVEKQLAGNLADSWEEQTTITTPERQLTQRKSFRRISPFEIVEAVTDYLIKEPEDFEQFRKYQPSLAQCDCTRIAHARQLLGNDGLTGPWVQGAFNMAGMHRNLTDLLEDAYIDPELFQEMMDYFSGRVIGFIRQAIHAGADFISMGGNMASGSMAGPKLFAEHVMPWEKRVIEAIHQEGAKVIYHNCGDARQLLPFYAEMNLDVYESLTAAPYGDTVLAEALAKISLPTALCGGIDQIDFLKTATPDEVRNQVKKVLEAAKPRGGFILATSDYISEGTPPENLSALAEAGLTYGKYI